MTLPRIIAARSAEVPDRTFLQNVDGSMTTYAEIDIRIGRWTHALADLGVTGGSTVVTMLPPSYTAVETWCAVAWLHGIEVPINTAYRGPMLQHCLRDSQADVAVVHSKFLDRFAELPESCSGLKVLVVVQPDDGVDEGVDGQSPRVPWPVMKSRELLAYTPESLRPADGPNQYDVASIIYTSGTTGPSKGVLVSWAQLSATVRGVPPLNSLGPDDAVYSPYPMFHVSGKLGVYSAALANGRCVLRDGFSTSSFWSDVRRFDCTSTLLVGTAASFLARRPQRPDDAENPLRYTNIGRLTTPGLENFGERFGVSVSTLFNMTELSAPIVSGWNPENRASCGRARPGYDIRIVNDYDEELPNGEVGELVVRADEPGVLMSGYWGKPEATVAAWRNQWLHTGDLFYQDEVGQLYFVDRKKDAIRRRGENISSMEVEEQIDGHPAVLESAVVGVPSDYGEEEVMAFVVPADASALDDPSFANSLAEFLDAKLPAFMVPRYYCTVSEIARTETGKMAKTTLRRLALDATSRRDLAASPATSALERKEQS